MNKLMAGVITMAIMVIAVMPMHVSAHVLAENNGISAVLHIPPYDAPEAGTATRVEFEFGTDTGGFRIADYTVKISVSDNGSLIQSSPVTAPYFGASSTGTATVNFPKVAVYQVHLVGSPKVSGSPAFAMNYSVRVATGNSTGMKTQNTSNANQTIYIGGAVFLLFAMFAARQVALGGRYGSPKHDKAGKN